MFWNRKNEGVVFTQFYKEILKIANRSPLSNNAEYELLPAMFVVSDYAAASAGKDRRKVADVIIEKIEKINHGLDHSSFDKRCNLYGLIIRGKQLRCEWCFAQSSLFNADAMTQCAALLCDILYNPECADNYDTAPVRLGSAFDSVNFTKTVAMPIANKFEELFKAIYEA